MQIFEFQFNPKSKDRRVETLSHEPDNGGGNLYLIGEMRGIVPGNEKLLGKIMRTMRDEYASGHPAEAFKRSLVKINEYLAVEVAKDNVSWLGNLHLAALSVSGNKIEMAKIGKISAFIIGHGKVEELDEKVKKGRSNGDFHPKAFGTLISGKIGMGERMAVLTEEAFHSFIKPDTLKKISELPFLDKKIVDGLVDERKKEISKISGAFLLIDTKGAPKRKKPFLSENEIDFSIKDVVAPIKKAVGRMIPGKRKKKRISFKLPKIGMREEYGRGLMLVFLMVILLISGSLIFRESERRQMEELSLRLERMEDSLSEADVLISTGRKSDAFSLLAGIHSDISDIGHPVFDDMKNEAESRLKTLSNFEMIRDPEPILRFEVRDFVPQRIIATGGRAFLYGPFSERVVEVNLSTMERIYHSVPGKPGSAAIVNGAPLFFSKPNTVFSVRNGKVVELGHLTLPRPEADLGGLIAFADNLYLRDSVSGSIVRYGSVDAEPEEWLSPETEKPANIRAMSTDGSIWLLNFESKISRYHAGRHVEDIAVEIFPFIRNISRISTSPANPHLFLLEPAESRVAIIDKRGRPVKQLVSDRFDNLIDLWVSDDGSEILLLNGPEVYRISI